MNKIISWFKGTDEKKEAFRTVYASDLERNSQFPKNKNLLEQFSRFMNRYFLLIGLLQLWPLITPVDPITTIGPLVFIFALSAVKEGFDDWHRYKSDLRANTKEICVYRGGKRHIIPSQEITVGDIVYIVEDDEIPCDVVMIKSSDPSGQAYLMTANIDGETNLKTRQSPAETKDMDLSQIQNFKGVIECALPNSEVYRFDSRMLLSPEMNDWIPLTSKQTLLQACHLRNTDWAYGIVVYSGNETKVGMNKRATPTKWSVADKFVDRSVMWLFISQFVLVVILGVTGDLWKEYVGRNLPYLRYLPPGNDPNVVNEPDGTFIVIPLRQLLLMSIVIPISLKVTLDIVKYLYSMFVDWDIQMYDPESDNPARASNTAIAEDLGQVEHVFTDKTGTLTDNIMVFIKCSINGVMYGNSVDCQDAFSDRNLESAAHSRQFEVEKFFQCLALCQSVVPGKRDAETGKIKLKGSSPDELALCDASERFGCEFVGRTLDSVTTVENFGENLGNTEKTYELLRTLDFTSKRKRMSVLVQAPNGEHFLFIKGADDVIFERLAPKQDEIQESTALHLETFAQMGLRTLVIAYRHVGFSEVEKFKEALHEARISLENREELEEEAYSSIECDLQLLGATAIEDKLQDQVPETIALLRKAGIRFWMLTGDKFSTAVQIATACNLMSPEPEGILLKMTGHKPEQVETSLIEAEGKVRSTTQKITMVISGQTLSVMLKVFPEKFLAVAMATDAVVCCRVTPEQKAEVVAHVKKEGTVCLSIGDGGNDVSMIQEAHVGVGIAGREGLQAARAADFSFSRFKFLSRLLLVHGRQAYRRTSFIAQYCFYKSIIIAFCQVAFGIYCGWSGSTFFNSFSVMLYNVFFTGMSLFFYPLDRDVPDDAVYHWPVLYQDGVKKRLLNRRTMIWWLLRAAFHGPVVFFMTVWTYNLTYLHPSDGSPMDMETISITTFSALIVVQMITLFIESNSLTFMNTGIIILSVLSYYLLNMVYTSFNSFDFYGIFWRALSDPNYWFSVIVITATAVVPLIAAKYVIFLYRPSPAQVVRANVLDKSNRTPFELRKSQASRSTPAQAQSQVKLTGRQQTQRKDMVGIGVGAGDGAGGGRGIDGSVSIDSLGDTLDLGRPHMASVGSAGSQEPFLHPDDKEKHK